MPEYDSKGGVKGARLLGLWALFMLGCGALVVALTYTVGQLIVGALVFFGLGVSFARFQQSN